MFLAFLVVMFLYAAIVFITVGVLDGTELSNSLTPLSLGASKIMGRAGSIALALAALLAFISTANAGILTASRASMAMSRDRLLPDFFQKINSKTKTPHLSIIFTSSFMIMVILFLSLENLVKTASTLKILLFLFVNLSLIVMRESKIQSYQPKFRAPLYPWLQIIGILGYGFLIFEMGTVPLTITGLFIACALTWYLVYAKKRVRRQAALVHVIERATAKELVDATLPDELKEIIIERDEIVEDRFDHLIKKSEILDIAQTISAKEVFDILADDFAKRFSIDKKKILDLFMEREKESSTVIAPGLAIPHIVIEGDKKFDIVLVRCIKGIIFPDTPQPVKTMFVLVGSKDERNFHLRALTAIAQIAQYKDFENKWLAARNIEELRDIILLAERKRFGIT